MQSKHWKDQDGMLCAIAYFANLGWAPLDEGLQMRRVHHMGPADCDVIVCY